MGIEALIAAPAATPSTPAAAAPTGAAPPAGASPPAAGGGTPPASNDTYYKDWPEDLHDIGKKYTGTAEVAKALRESQKLIGGDPKTLLRKPAEGDVEGQGKFWNELGRPDKPEGYKLEGDLSKDETVKAMLPGMHSLGLTQAQVEGLAKMSAEQAGAINAASETAFKSQIVADTAALKAEWGQGFDGKIAQANAAIAKLGFTDADITALAKSPGRSPAAVLKMLAEAGAGLVEAKSHGGQGGAASGFGNLTPAEAQAQWSALAKDPAFVARMKRNDPLALQQKRELDAARRGISVADFTAGTSH